MYSIVIIVAPFTAAIPLPSLSANANSDVAGLYSSLAP